MSVILHKGDLPDTLSFSGRVAIDTETMGLNPLRDRLCLVQISQGDNQTHLVQISRDQTTAPNLCQLLLDPHIEKIFHFARFDIAVLFHTFGVMPAPVFCTKIASRLARTYTDRHGLKDVTRELLQINLSKEQQSSNWGADILSQEQLEYAASDVLYLHAIRDKLHAMLEATGRVELASCCFSFLSTRCKLDLAGWSDEDIFVH